MDPPGQRSIDQADLVAASVQFSWPPAFSSLAVSVQDLTAADIHRERNRRSLIPGRWCHHWRRGVPCCWRNSAQGGPMRLAGDIGGAYRRMPTGRSVLRGGKYAPMTCFGRYQEFVCGS